jgi:hypothetical protein
MVKLVFLCRRRPDLSHERYVELLLGGHVPLALAHHETMRRYVVNIVEETLGEGPPLDSIGALWFGTLADFRERLCDSSEGERLIARDVGRFMGGADAFVTHEHAAKAPPVPRRLGTRSQGTKLFVCVRRPPGASPETFVGDWLAERVQPLVARGAVAACVANAVEERLGTGAPDYQAIVELWPAREASAVLEALCVPTVAACYRAAEYVQRW